MGCRVFNFFKRRGKKAPDGPAPRLPSGAEVAAAWEQAHALRSGDAERPARVPAWALILRSPFLPWDDARSWLGGQPCAPAGFVWPRSAEGKPLHFLAQIDCADVPPDPVTGARPPGLPQSGAVLVFADYSSYAAIPLTKAQMTGAGPVSLPEDMPPLAEIGHWSEDLTFTRWPVAFVPFLDDGEGAAPTGPDFSDPAQWITTWDMARHEAAFVLAIHDRLQADLARPGAAGRGRDDHKAMVARLSEPASQDIIAALRKWHDIAAAQPAEAAVDRQALAGLFVQRRRLAEGLARFPLVLALRGTPGTIWEQLLGQRVQPPGKKEPLPLITQLQRHQTRGVPPGLRPFVEVNVARWRGHKLFGLVKDLEFNEEDRRGHDVLLTIHGDMLVGTQREHSHATSIWCRRAALASGDLSGGLLLQHGNG